MKLPYLAITAFSLLLIGAAVWLIASLTAPSPSPESSSPSSYTLVAKGERLRVRLARGWTVRAEGNDKIIINGIDSCPRLEMVASKAQSSTSQQAILKRLAARLKVLNNGTAPDISLSINEKGDSIAGTTLINLNNEAMQSGAIKSGPRSLLLWSLAPTTNCRLSETDRQALRDLPANLRLVNQ